MMMKFKRLIRIATVIKYCCRPIGIGLTFKVDIF